jgi:hypothetical protein
VLLPLRASSWMMSMGNVTNISAPHDGQKRALRGTERPHEPQLSLATSSRYARNRPLTSPSSHE